MLAKLWLRSSSVSFINQQIPHHLFRSLKIEVIPDPKPLQSIEMVYYGCFLSSKLRTSRLQLHYVILSNIQNNYLLIYASYNVQVQLQTIHKS